MDLHDQPIVNTPLVINLLPLPRLLIPNALDLHPPEHDSHLHSQHTDSDMSARTDSPAEAKGDMAFFFGSLGPGLQLSRRLVDISTRIEQVCIGAIVGWITVDVPYVGYQRGAFGDGVPVVSDFRGRAPG